MAYSTNQPLATLLQVDISMPHEQIPAGVPSNYSWWAVPVIQAGNNPGSAFVNANPWGQVYESNLGNPYPGDKVEVRDLQAWVLSKATNTWSALYSTPPTIGGAEFPQNFQGSSVGGNIDTKSDPGAIEVAPDPGRLFHFYPNVARATVNPTDINGVISVARVRLADQNEKNPCPGLIANVGFDYWAGPTSGTVAGCGQGRFKIVKRDWRVLTFTTLTLSQIQAMHLGSTGAPPVPPVTFDNGELY